MCPVTVGGTRISGVNVSRYFRQVSRGHVSAVRESRAFTDQGCDFTAQCSNYLCPGTLACVSFPHHCPCAHPDVEEKVELGEGSAICVSKGGFKAGEASRKIELARKGLL
jgi:hypothetical protein